MFLAVTHQRRFVVATLRRKIEVALLEAAWNDEREVPISLDKTLAWIAARRLRRAQLVGSLMAKHWTRMVASAGS
jgi:hypothetical protein